MCEAWRWGRGEERRAEPTGPGGGATGGAGPMGCERGHGAWGGGPYSAWGRGLWGRRVGLTGLGRGHGAWGRELQYLGAGPTGPGGGTYRAWGRGPLPGVHNPAPQRRLEPAPPAFSGGSRCGKAPVSQARGQVPSLSPHLTPPGSGGSRAGGRAVPGLQWPFGSPRAGALSAPCVTPVTLLGARGALRAAGPLLMLVGSGPAHPQSWTSTKHTQQTLPCLAPSLPGPGAGHSGSTETVLLWVSVPGLSVTKGVLLAISTGMVCP